MKLDATTVTKVIFDFIEHHIPGKRALLCGTSMGGWVAMIYSSVYPEHIIGIILNGCLINTQTWKFGIGISAMKMVLMIDEQTRVHMAYKFLEKDLGEVKAKEIISGGLFYECWGEMWDMIGKCDFIHYISMVNAPILFLLTDKDTNNLNEKEFLDAARNYKRVLRKGGHSYAIENPEMFAVDVHLFISEKILSS